MARKPPIHEGDSTILYPGMDSGTLIQYFKDDSNILLDGTENPVVGKGVLNNRISMFLMSRLDEIGIPTHVIQPLNMREQLIYALDMLPLKVVVRNFAAGNMCKRLGIAEGEKLPYPIIEFFHTDKKRESDGLINVDHIELMNWANEEEMEEISDMALRINDFMSGFFLGMGLRLIDFKLEFGRFWRNEYDYILVLGDVLTPDTCRLIDTKQKTQDNKFELLRGKMDYYQLVARRLGVLTDQPIETLVMPADEDKLLSAAKGSPTHSISNVRQFRKKNRD